MIWFLLYHFSKHLYVFSNLSFEIISMGILFHIGVSDFNLQFDFLGQWKIYLYTFFYQSKYVKIYIYAHMESPFHWHLCWHFTQTFFYTLPFFYFIFFHITLPEEILNTYFFVCCCCCFFFFVAGEVVGLEKWSRITPGVWIILYCVYQKRKVVEHVNYHSIHPFLTPNNVYKTAF